MPRIRTIKPEFFTHEGLYDLEQKTGFPVRTAFSGLWCQADREGKFRWQPRRLKLHVLPYDELDFENVLDALMAGGFLIKYMVNEECYGYIPTFMEHQFINDKEEASKLPDYTDEGVQILTVDNNNIINGKEGKGKEHIYPGGVRAAKALRTRTARAQHARRTDAKKIEEIRRAYPRMVGKPRAISAIKKAIQKGADPDWLLERTKKYAELLEPYKEEKGQFIPYPATWFNGEGYNDAEEEWVRGFRGGTRTNGDSDVMAPPDPLPPEYIDEIERKAEEQERKRRKSEDAEE